MRNGLLAWTLASLASFSGAQEVRHHGTITGIVPFEGGMLVSSQSGILFHPRESAPPARALVVPDFRVQSIALALDGAIFAAGGIPGESAIVARFTADSHEQTPPSRKDLAYGIAVAPDGKRIAVAHADGSVVVAQPEDLPAATWTLRHKHTATALAVAFSPDGSLLASCGLDGVVLVSNTADAGHKPRMLDDHTAGIECLTFSPDGKWIASGSRDSKVRIHESATGRLVRTYSSLGMENEPVAGRVIARVTAILWSDRGLVAGTSKGILYELSETDDSKTLLLTDATAKPITAMCIAHDRLFVAIAGQLRSF